MPGKMEASMALRPEGSQRGFNKHYLKSHLLC